MRLVDRIFIVIYFILTFTLIVLSKRRRVLIAFTAGMLLVVLKVSETMRIETISEFVDFNAIFLLIGMMVIVGVLKSTGFFQYVAVRTLRATKGNILLLSGLFSALIALFSMVLDNVTTMIMFMPIIFFVADTAGFNPFGFTAVMILASNIGDFQRSCASSALIDLCYPDVDLQIQDSEGSLVNIWKKGRDSGIKARWSHNQ